MTRRPKVELSGIIEAPFSEVTELLLRVAPGPIGHGNAWLLADTNTGKATLTGGPDRFRPIGNCLRVLLRSCQTGRPAQSQVASTS